MSDRRFASVLERMSLESLNITPILPGETKETSDALSSLGYNELAKRQQGRDLVQTLQKLEIRPFTNESVETYKKQKLADVRRMYNRVILISLTCSVTALLLIATALLTVEVSLPGWGWLLALLILCVGPVVTLSVVDIRERIWWQPLYLKQYKKPLPVPVTRLIASIHEALPDANFGIQFIADTDNDNDPFLVVEYGDRYYYIAVWEEPKFEAELSA